MAQPLSERESVCLCPADLKPGEMRGIKVGERYVLLVNVAGTYYAMGNVCTHAGYSLHKGMLDGFIVTCILHGAEFDIRTGEHISDPMMCDNERTYPVEIRDGKVYIAF